MFSLANGDGFVVIEKHGSVFVLSEYLKYLLLVSHLYYKSMSSVVRKRDNMLSNPFRLKLSRYKDTLK